MHRRGLLKINDYSGHGRPGRLVRAAVSALLMSLWVAGCSTRFFYERIDWFVVWQIESYVSLEPEQKESLQQDVQGFLDDARVRQLPVIETWLLDVAEEFDTSEVTPADLDKRYAESMKYFEDFMFELIPIAARFLRGLSDEQVAELTESLTEVNDEMYDEYSGETEGARAKNRDKQTIKSIERFTGRLSKEQKQLVRTRMASMADSSERWIAYQRQWQGMFIKLIAERPPEPEFSERLTQLFVYPRDFHDVEYRMRVEENRHIAIEMLAELFAGLSDKQRKRLVGEFEDLAGKLNKLASLPPPERQAAAAAAGGG